MKKLLTILALTLTTGVSFGATIDDTLKDHQDQINQNNSYIRAVDNRLYETESKLERGIAMASALSMIDFGKIENNEVAVGAGVASAVGAEAVGIGVAYGATDKLTFTVKGAMTTDGETETVVGAGVVYKFKLPF